MIVPYEYMQNVSLIMIVFLSYCKFINIASNIDNKRKRMWTREIYEQNEREMHGFYQKVFKVIKDRDSNQFHKACRMGVPQFEKLFSILKEKLTKNSPRTPIQAECRLVITLMFLAQSSSWQTLAWAFRMGVSTVREIILETCEVIWDELNGIYLSPPSYIIWKQIAIDNFNTSGMPNCVGAIDGRHIRIKCPPHGGSLYYNYKNYHSIVLLAACDSNYCFTAVDIGAYGSQSDGGILQASGFGSKILHGDMNLPADEVIPNSDVIFPYYFVGDAAFPLKNNLMRPYSRKNLTKDQETFNKRLSSARVKIENTFGIMTTKWRVLLNSINCFPTNAEKIVKAVVVLHNFAKMNDPSYCPVNNIGDFNEDIQGLWRKNKSYIPQCRFFTRFNAPRSSFALRDILMEYICHQHERPQ